MFGKLENRGVVKAARGFSLVELLVVIGIISLLIGIALPAFRAAKERAKIATTTATINTIAMGLDTLRADTRLGGEYPPSDRVELAANPHIPNGTVRKMRYANGANLLVYALAGADLLGSAGIRDANNSGTWSDDLNAQISLQGLYCFAPGTVKPAVARTSFVDVTKMKFPQKATTSISGDPEFELPASKARMMSLTFLDSFDQPILYYRASPGQAGICTCKWAMTSGRGGGGGIYDFSDNADITGARQSGWGVPGLDIGAGTSKHFPIEGDNGWQGSPSVDLVNPAKRDTFKGTFAYTISNPNVTATATPHNPETYILLSAGPDGLFGTEDDVGNFPVNK